jgi:hypothetical protein
MARTTITAGRVQSLAYGVRHWKTTLFVALVVMPVTVMFRFISGRNLIRGGRSTDATFFHGAREVRRGWWSDKPGAARAAIRLCGVAALLLWFIEPLVVYVLLALEAVVLVCVGVRRYREQQHEKKVLRPVWPAVAGIIGIPASQPPTRWLDIPHNFLDDPAAVPADEPAPEIAVGLLAADTDDERRVRALVQLFDQRFGCRHHGTVDYARRLVRIRRRPAEPYCWIAISNVLGLPSSELAVDWLEMPSNPAEPGSRISVRLPADVVNNVPIRDELGRVIDQQFPGEWASKVVRATDTAPAFVVLTHKHPPKKPPTYVDFLAEHPDYQETN